MAEQRPHAPHLIDTDVTNALRRQVASGQVDARTAWHALDRWRRLGMVRYPVVGLVARVWELRQSVSAFDASYVAIAEALGCSLYTAGARRRQAPGARCPITVVPR